MAIVSAAAARTKRRPKRAGIPNMDLATTFSRTTNYAASAQSGASQLGWELVMELGLHWIGLGNPPRLKTPPPSPTGES